MASGRFRQPDPAARAEARGGRGRGLITMTLALPRNVIVKRLASGKLGFYFNVQSIYRKHRATDGRGDRWIANVFYARCMQARWHDRARRSGSNGGPRPRPIGP